MKRVNEMDDEVSPENGSQEKPELSLDLNFLPAWAKKPPENTYTSHNGRDGGGRGRERSGRRENRRGGFGDRRDSSRAGGRPGGGGRPSGGGGSFRRPGGGFRPGSGSSHRPGGGFSRPRRDEDRRGSRREGGDRRPSRSFQPRLDVRISFLPDRERLALVVQDIQASRRAFPLIEIANRFLGRDDLYSVKLELPTPAEGAPRQTFLQCLECQRVFRSRERAEAHLLSDHLDKFFLLEETEVEPPKGAFTCVGRCRLSGTLLGPSNYHGYNEKIQELWSSRFGHMSKSDYLRTIETVRDEALVEKWKDSLRKKTIYRLKEVPEGQEVQEMTQVQARAWMSESRLKSLLRESGRCMVPGPESKRFEDGPLRQAMLLAWQKENRFPFTLSLALRPAFRHMHLHLFKVNAKETYVTAVLPKPVDLETAPKIVREIITYLEAHPGQTRQQVLEGLRVGVDPESSDAAEVLLHMGNLIANGGLIEFFNATLALPRGGGRPDEKFEKAASKKDVKSKAKPPKSEKKAIVLESAASDAEKKEELLVGASDGSPSAKADSEAKAKPVSQEESPPDSASPSDATEEILPEKNAPQNEGVESTPSVEESAKPE